MQRVIRGRSATLSQTFYIDGVPTDPSPDAATITIVRADGTALVTDATATNAGTGIATYTLTPAQTALLDTLTVTWSASFGGETQTFTDTVEIAGGYVFSITQARQLDVFATATVEAIAQARQYAEEELESALGFALVPRYSRISTSPPAGLLPMPRPYVRAVRSVSVDGAAWTQDQIDTVTFSDFGGIQTSYGWWSNSTIVIGYEHGLDGPSAGAVRAALALAADSVPSTTSIDPRVESIVTVDGTLRFSGDGFGLPVVDSYVAANRLTALA